MSLIMEKDFSELEVTECKLYRNQIVTPHELCGGLGMVASEEFGGIEDCDCEAVFKYIKLLVYSRLPKRHWSVSLDSVKQLFLSEQDLPKYNKLTQNNYNDCSSLIFGEAGKGKTAFLALLGKGAICLGKTVFYLPVEDLLYYVRKDSENKIFVDRMQGSDIILIDDITKFNKSEWAVGQIEYNLRKFYDNGANLIISSSFPVEIIAEKYSSGLASLMDRMSYRFVVDWSGKGKLNTTEYLTDPILSEARKYFKSSLTL